MPTLEKLYRQNPESLPFQQPVDPHKLQIPVSISPFDALFSNGVQISMVVIH